MTVDNFMNPEQRKILEERAKGPGSSAAYARLQLTVLGHFRQAIADEIALGTQPNDVAIALGSIFGFVLVEMVAMRTDNPSHNIARAAAAYAEQTCNMMITATMAVSQAPGSFKPIGPK